ncbi:MAG TPA: L-histidine N(alpha)-methyltransferase [Verrucomicrobiae bacterium]|nr:L-histidine N(alpha)-methyltransferase [Verrucomicrobiae bacterium]
MRRPSSFANIAIHSSQFPERVRRDLLASLRTRRVNHKFHYDSVKQTQKWLALHQIYSPSRNDADCAATYDRAFAEAVKQIKTRRIHVIGLGCGGGQKDTRLLKLLNTGGKEISYTPCDVSTAMVLVAREAAMSVVPEKSCFPFVCDLATAETLPKVFRNGGSPQGASLVTFFGMIPNFEPQDILPRLASLVRRQDHLLFSANLAPGGNYAAGIKKVLPQYDNAPTRDWLLTFLLDLGVGCGDGKLHFTIEAGGLGLKRIVAKFQFSRACSIDIETETFTFRRGESIRLFFSYRYTPALVRKNLAKHGLEVLNQWITQSEEEGVFLVRRSGVSAERRA